jgi:hypothetical protein
MLVPAPASAGVRVGLGFYGGYYGPIYPYGFYGPYPYPYAYPYGYYAARPLGEVKIKSPDDDAQIFINGAFAGRAHDLKRFYLVPGTYSFEQRIGPDVQKQRVFVIANRTLKIEFGKPGTPSPQAAPPSAQPARPAATPVPPPPPPPPPAPAAEPAAQPPVSPSVDATPQAPPLPAN